MKKKGLIICGFLSLFVFSVKSAPVTENEAKNVADVFCAKKGIGGKLSLSDLKREDCYIFNSDVDGYVIVSADDNVTPILGYSKIGSIDNAGKNADAFTSWLNSIDEGVDSLLLKIEETQIDKSKWELLKSGDFPVSTRSSQSVAPLLSTTWSQYEPYNLLCPENSVSGCVSVAMAQVLKYYNYPKMGVGSSEEYVTETNGYKIPSVSLSEEYDWSNMLDDYSGEYSQVEADAVSKLIYHCGITAFMDYDSVGSGTTVINAAKALYNHFDYDKSIRYLSREYYTNEQWHTLLKEQLNRGYPIIYSGNDEYETSGHSFICDGYDEDGFYHFNFGWGGYYDGYYSLDFIVPIQDSISENVSDYSYSQNALIDIFPNENGNYHYDFVFRKTENFKVVADTLTAGQPLEIYAEFFNTGLVGFEGFPLLLLRDSIGTEISILSNDIISVDDYGSYNINIRLPINGLPDGVYFVEFCLEDSLGHVYKVRDSGDSISCRKFVIDSSHVSNQPAFDFIYSQPDDFKISPDTILNGDAFDVYCRFYNGGYADFDGKLWMEIQDDSGNLIERICLGDSLALSSYAGYWFELGLEGFFFPNDGIYRIEILLEKDDTWYTVRNAEDSITYRTIVVGNVTTILPSLSADVAKLSVRIMNNYLILSSEEKEWVEVYDLSGRKIKELNVLGEIRLELSSGCYIVKSQNSVVKVVL